MKILVLIITILTTFSAGAKIKVEALPTPRGLVDFLDDNQLNLLVEKTSIKEVEHYFKMCNESIVGIQYVGITPDEFNSYTVESYLYDFFNELKLPNVELSIKDILTADTFLKLKTGNQKRVRPIQICDYFKNDDFTKNKNLVLTDNHFNKSGRATVSSLIALKIFLSFLE